MWCSIEIPPEDRPELSPGLRAWVVMLLLLALIMIAVYVVSRFAGPAMAVVG